MMADRPVGGAYKLVVPVVVRSIPISLDKRVVAVRVLAGESDTNNRDVVFTPSIVNDRALLIAVVGISSTKNGKILLIAVVGISSTKNGKILLIAVVGTASTAKVRVLLTVMKQ